MTKLAAELVYFERWLDPVAQTVLSRRPEIELVRLSYGDPVAEKTCVRISDFTANRTSGSWFGDRDLFAKCSLIDAFGCLAVSLLAKGVDAA
jgi:hypothetical protein